MVGSPPPSLIFDASTLINLYATGRIREIAQAVPYQFIVSKYVLDHEALYVRVPDGVGGFSSLEMDLDQLVDSGLLNVESLQGAEQAATLVDLSQELDESEARTAAIAHHRGFMIATDDRKARRVLTDNWPSLRVMSTTQLLQIWAESANVTESELMAAFHAIESGARFVPGPHDPLFEWWEELRGRPRS